MHNSSFCNRKSSFFNRKSSCFNINHQISIEKRHFLAHRGEDHRTGIDSSTTKPARDRTCKFIERMQPTLSPYPPRLARAVTTSTAGRRAGLGCPAWAGAPAQPSPAQRRGAVGRGRVGLTGAPDGFPLWRCTPPAAAWHVEPVSGKAGGQCRAA